MRPVVVFILSVALSALCVGIGFAIGEAILRATGLVAGCGMLWGCDR